MNFRKIIEPLYNPALGILPLILVMVLGFFVPYRTAFLGGISLLFVSVLFSILFFRYSPPYMLITTGLVFIIYAACSIISPIKALYPEFPAIVYELLMVLTLCLIWTFKRHIREKVKSTDKVKRAMKLTKLDEFFYVTRLYKNVFILHLLLVLVYTLLPTPYHDGRMHVLIHYILIFLMVLLVIVYEYIRLIMLNDRMKSEDWLPIVNETGGVTGRVAFSVSHTSKKNFLHPVVRIALIYNGLLYLKERPDHYVSDPDKVDYPFEKYVFYKHTLEDTVGNALQKGCGIRDLPVRFVFRHLFQNEVTHRLVYLYTCHIQNEETMNKLKLGSGKLWTDKQIEENLNKGVFSEYFEKEYEVLKNTVLMADKLVRKIELQATEDSA